MHNQVVQGTTMAPARFGKPVSKTALKNVCALMSKAKKVDEEGLMIVPVRFQDPNTNGWREARFYYYPRDIATLPASISTEDFMNSQAQIDVTVESYECGSELVMGARVEDIIVFGGPWGLDWP